MGCAARAASATCGGCPRGDAVPPQAGRRRVQPGLHLRRAMRRLPDGAERDKETRGGVNFGEHTAMAEQTPFFQYRPQQIHSTLPAFSVQNGPSVQNQGCGGGAAWTSGDAGLPCTGPVQPSILRRGLLYVQSRSDESAAIDRLPLSKGGRTANVACSFHHNGRAKGSGRPIIIPTISRRWYCPPSKQAQLASENRSLLKEQG